MARKLNFIYSLIMVLSMTLLIVTLAQNILVRTSAGYTFYFNDTGVVNNVAFSYTNSQMSKEITSFMNSWKPDEFQVYEDTGYDLEKIFSEEDSNNMLAIKKAADIGFIVCILSLITTVAIYIHFLKNRFKLVLRKRMKCVTALVAIILAGEMFIMKTAKGLSWILNLVGVEKMAETSALKTLLGGSFVDMAGNFLFGYTIITFLIALYVTLMLTKPPRIFY